MPPSIDAPIDASLSAGVHAAVAAYATLLDGDTPGDVADLFCPDGVVEIVGIATFEGRDAIRAGYAGWAPVRPQLHLVGNTVITASTADSAGATSDLAFFQRGERG